jgi:hypothetical protein
MTSKGFLFLLFAMILALAVSCEKSPDPAGPAEPDTKLEDRLVVSYDETRTASEVASFRETPWHSIFDRLLEEKGYQVWSGDAAHFKAVDPATGKIGHMTLIPCSVPGDDSRVAIIEYFRGDEGCAVTAAEYYECEEYQIAHPIDERTGLSMLGDEASQGLKLELIERSEASKRCCRLLGMRDGMLDHRARLGPLHGQMLYRIPGRGDDLLRLYRIYGLVNDEDFNKIRLLLPVLFHPDSDSRPAEFEQYVR